MRSKTYLKAKGMAVKHGSTAFVLLNLRPSKGQAAPSILAMIFSVRATMR